MTFSLARRWFLTLSLLAPLAPRGFAEELSAAAKDAPVALPAYTVTDSRELPPPEAWRYTQMPGFEILSNASDRQTVRLLKDFQMFNQAIGIVWPSLLGHSPVPVSLIICGRGGKFDAFVPKKAVGADATQALASLFLRDDEHSAIVVDFEAREIAMSGLETLGGDAAGGVENNGFMEVDAYKQLYREYVHSLLARANPRLPAWVEEGLAQLLMGMKFDRKHIEFAKLEDPNTVSIAQGIAADQNAASAAAGDTDAPQATAAAEDRDFNAALQRRPLMKFPEMFAVTHDSPVALNPLGSNWAKQSCAFVHMCLYGEKQRYQKGFITFIMRTTKEAPTEALFKECFGASFSSMLVALRGYIDYTNYKSLEWNAKGGFPEPTPITMREATQSEVGRMKGEAFTMAGRINDARAAFVAPYTRGERDPSLLAALGLYERTAGNEDRARKFLEAATAAKVVRPRAYLELARLRYQDALAKPAGPDGRLSPGQTSGVVSLLLPARTQPPAMPEIYELMGDTLVRGTETPTKDTLQVMLDGVNLFPRRLGIAYQAAVLCARAGEFKGAAALVELGLRNSQDERAKARFAELKATLPPSPANPAPAAKS